MPNSRRIAYRDDLAYIHDVGFGEFSARAAPWLLDLLRTSGHTKGLIVDLGCGSGIWAAAAVKAGFDVLGYDLSPAMVSLARRRVGKAEFREASFVEAAIPPCVAVTAIGEIFNYLSDERNTRGRLGGLFGRVHRALRPSGLFVFDVALPGRVPGGRRRDFTKGPNWACLFEAREDSALRNLTREITSFRRVGNTYRRDHETHRLILHDRSWLLARLRKMGFRARTIKGYGQTVFPPGLVGFVARKN